MLRNTKNTNTMISSTSQLPAAVKVCAIDLNLHKMAMQFYYVKLMNSLFYLLLFCRLLTGALTDKGYVFLLNQMRWG
jgi:hypothetical protein